MRKARFVIPAVLAIVAVFAAVTTAFFTDDAAAHNDPVEYVWLAASGLGGGLCIGPPGCPDEATASNGDTIVIVGEGTLSVHPKSATGSGTFTHIFAAGGSVSGTWEATGELLNFRSYGPSPATDPDTGELIFPESFEAGLARIPVELFVGRDSVGNAILSVGCILPEVKMPGAAFEGSRLNVQGGLNVPLPVAPMRRRRPMVIPS